MWVCVVTSFDGENDLGIGKRLGAHQCLCAWFIVGLFSPFLFVGSWQVD